MKESWVLEWSRKQNSFHIQKEASAIESNLNALVSDYARDYILLHRGARDECERAASNWRHRLKIGHTNPLRIRCKA